MYLSSFFFMALCYTLLHFPLCHIFFSFHLPAMLFCNPNIITLIIMTFSHIANAEPQPQPTNLFPVRPFSVAPRGHGTGAALRAPFNAPSPTAPNIERGAGLACRPSMWSSSIPGPSSLLGKVLSSICNAQLQTLSSVAVSPL